MLKMTKNKWFILLFVVLSFSFIFFFYKNHYQTVLVMGHKVYVVDVSDNTFTLERGLSGRMSLPDDGGMLFVFGKPDNYGFWMKDMNFPIDIIWMDEKYTIIHIEKSLSPETYPNIYYPNKDSLYVLEVNAGETSKQGVKVGDKVRVLR